jgi:uncharacterized protein with von Willebrand factor type A (vWA) domain
MRKLFKGMAELAGMALVLAGIVVGMCETADADKQVMTMGIGLLMIAAGAVVSVLVNRGEEDEYLG